jgi:ribosome assembly protein YihI (activator of Der GTPase)
MSATQMLPDYSQRQESLFRLRLFADTVRERTTRVRAAVEALQDAPEELQQELFAWLDLAIADMNAVLTELTLRRREDEEEDL